MTPSNKPKSGSTLKTLIRVTRALREPPPDSATPSGSLRDTLGKAVGNLRNDPRLREAADKVTEIRARAGERADQRLTELISENRAKQGQTPPQEVTTLLEQRRQERNAKLERARARQDLLNQAQTSEQRRVLTTVAAVTPWAGGEIGIVRYTELLDHLAPGGNAVTEMAIHRALWTLAERRVLAVSPHGVITAIRTITPAQNALPEN